MSWTAPATAHPILACVQTVGDALDEVAEVDPLFMTPADQAAALVEVQRGLDRLAELQLRLLAAAEDMAAGDGARDPAGWIAHRTRIDRAEARRRQRLARALGSRWRRVAEAMRDGAITLDQVQVMVRALDELPADLDPDLRERAEKHLVHAAGDHDPRELRILGRKLLEVIDPETAEDQERRLVENEERAALKRTWLSFGNHGDGTTSIKGRIPTPAADRLRTYLDSFANPRRADDAGSDPNPGSTDAAAGKSPTNPDRSPYDVRLGRAFCSLLERWDPKRLPIHGGAATTVMVTLDYQALRSGLGVATTDTGGRITAAEARRLACMAGIIPVVLGKDSEVLDLGRTARLFTPAQRKALVLRDKTCRADGCDQPATWSEAHHLKPWADGGPTDLDNGILLCCWHHHRAHDPDYHHERLPNGDLHFHRRT